MMNSTGKIINHKTGLRNLAEKLGNVSKACQVMGYSRDTFYRYIAAVGDGGVEAQFERSRPAWTAPKIRGSEVGLVWRHYHNG